MTDKTMTGVRDWHLEAYKVTGQPKHKDMADFLAERIEADERAVPHYFTADDQGRLTQTTSLHKNRPGTVAMYTHPPAQAAQVSNSLNAALNALEDAAVNGLQLHGDDIHRFRALVDRIATHSTDAAETTNPSEISSKLVGAADTLSKPPRFGGCCCGEPCTLGVVHRTDGPCFVYEQPADSGRVGDEFKFTDEDIRLALDYSRNYATARPDISPTAKEHVSGLCDRLESLLADRAALASQGQGESCPYCDGTGDVHSIDGEWCGECTACPAAMEHAFKNFHRQLCERFGCAHDEKDWRRDQVSLIEHIAAKVQASPAGVPDGMVLVPRWIIGNTLRAIRDVDTQFRATGHPSWRFEQLANLLAPLAAAPSAPEGGEVGL